MEDYIDVGAGIFGGIFGGALSWFIGGLDGALKILVAMMVADYITGLMKGYIRGELSSSEGFHGIAKKVCMFLFVGVANIIDNELLGRSEVLRDAVIFFYIANEGLSITENAIDIGLPVPDSVKSKFKEWVHKDSELGEPGKEVQHHPIEESISVSAEEVPPEPQNSLPFKGSELDQSDGDGQHPQEER